MRICLHKVVFATLLNLMKELGSSDRLALFIQRYGVTYEKVAWQLGWSEEQLRYYLSSEARSVRAPSDIADATVDSLLMKYCVALAHQTLRCATTRPLNPLYMSCRRSTVPKQFGQIMTDTKSIFRADVTPAQREEVTEIKEPHTGNRRRLRKVIVKPLHALRTQAAAKQEGMMYFTNTSYYVPKTQRAASQELICPIRLDVNLDGIRFQDTFLVNARYSALTSCSPEMLAAQIAQDENMTDRLQIQDAVAESIRRQILTFTSSLMTIIHKNEYLYPIYLDLIINGYFLRDQFEWDVSNDCEATQAFASTLCADLNLSQVFEPAIVFSIYEQVASYRVAISGCTWIGADLLQSRCAGFMQPLSKARYIEVMPPLDGIVRFTEDAKLWQPVLRELSHEERTYLNAKLTGVQAPTKVAESTSKSKRTTRHVSKDGRFPRPLNPFIVYCQMQKDALGKTRRSASETRKIMGDMWRKCTEEDKEYYSQLTEVENEKRRRDYILDVRDRAIADWEEDEARRKGLVASSTVEASTEHFRGLLLENYMGERHEVDRNRLEAVVDISDEDENGDNYEMEDSSDI